MPAMKPIGQLLINHLPTRWELRVNYSNEWKLKSTHRHQWQARRDAEACLQRGLVVELRQVTIVP